ncbi:MAG: HDOD domain-containing protein [Methylococcales bacterium]
MFEGFIGRTPIYNKSLELFGYDLQFGCQESAETIKSEKGFYSKDCIANVSSEIPLEKITGPKIGFIDAFPSLLSDLVDFSWPKDRIIFRVTDPLLASENFTADLQKLSSQGFSFDLEAHRYGSIKEQALDGAKICSIDADAVVEDFGGQLQFFRGRRGIKLLARNIQTPDQYSWAKQIGFDYYQGNYFEKPRQFQGSEIPANRLAVMHLLARLQDPEIEINEVEVLVSQDVTLSYKLLRLINSAFFGVPKTVESISRAVIIYGLQRVANWAAVIMINAIDYKPQELLVTALVRAKTCELLAEAMGQEKTEQYYIAGLFSVLDAIMNVPMARLVEHLCLIDEISNALTDKNGPIGEVLATVIAYEHGGSRGLPQSPLEDSVVTKICLQAMEWASQVNFQVNQDRK